MPGLEIVHADLDPEALRESLQLANVPTLLMVLVQLTGDFKWLSPPYAPGRAAGIDDNDSGGLPEDIQAEIMDAAYEQILRFARDPGAQVYEPTEDELVRMLRVSIGERGTARGDEYGPMIAAELVASRARSAAPGERLTPGGPLPADMAAAPANFHAVIIGAGISGITMAMNFEAAGISYEILEKNDEVGGTWLVNQYPGAGVDTPNHLYSWPSMRNDWDYYFALRDEVQGYLVDVANGLGLRQHIKFGAAVSEARYDEDSRQWLVTYSDSPAGPPRTAVGDVLISAVGLFSTPKIPDIEGLGSFRGQWFHSSDCPEGLDVSGKRVALIGSGASAMQIGPAIAGEVEHLDIFQRSPQWAAPFAKFRKQVPPEVTFLLREVPLYQAWYRVRLMWTFNDKIWTTLQKDPKWPHPERSLNRVNDRFREIFTEYIKSELGDRTDLLAKALPTYPPYGKRILLDNGWWRTLTRPNVELITKSVARVTEDSVVTEDGASYPADTIILATGFNAVQFLATYDLVGKGGVHVRELWQGDDARAYMGTFVPGFPNFFCLYGPNLQTGQGGSFVNVAVVQTHYVMVALNEMFKRGIRTIDAKQDVTDEYNRVMEAAHERMVWTHPGMTTYYRNSKGRVTVNAPHRNIDYFLWTRYVNLDNFNVEFNVERDQPEQGRLVGDAENSEVAAR